LVISVHLSTYSLSGHDAPKAATSIQDAITGRLRKKRFAAALLRRVYRGIESNAVLVERAPEHVRPTAERRKLSKAPYAARLRRAALKQCEKSADFRAIE
ncbi:hypothetical protein, partial [Caballeronia sp. LZ024]|uniref:hypothetical protein n=1 Tax=Caballeronia sp. LZ024 TaxID=3038561 RepID=UPI002858A4F3